MLGKIRVFFMVLLAILFVSCDTLNSDAEDLGTLENSVVGIWRGSAAAGGSWVITFNVDKTFDQISSASGFSFPTDGSWKEVTAVDVPGSTTGESYIQLVASISPDSPYYFWSNGDLLDNMQSGDEHAELVKD